MAIRARLPRINVVAGGSIQSVTCNLISSTATVYQPAVSTRAVLSLNQIPSTATIFSHSLTSSATVSLNFLSSGAVFYNAQVVRGVTASPGLSLLGVG